MCVCVCACFFFSLFIHSSLFALSFTGLRVNVANELDQFSKQNESKNWKCYTYVLRKFNWPRMTLICIIPVALIFIKISFALKLQPNGKHQFIRFLMGFLILIKFSEFWIWNADYYRCMHHATLLFHLQTSIG